MNDEPENNVVDLVPSRREPSILLAEEPQGGILQRFPGLSQKRFTEEQAKTLEAPIPADDLDILPTGEIYLSQVQYRRILNDAFGPGGWGLVPSGDFYQDGETLCREYSLFAEGRFVSSAIGESDFQPNNPRHSKATAAESLKSNALMRCCKDLGIASECWDKRANAVWIKTNAVAVWCVGVAKGQYGNEGKKKKLWRRRDAERFEYPWREEGRTPAPPPEQPPPPEDVPTINTRADVEEMFGPEESVDLGALAAESPAATPPLVTIGPQPGSEGPRVGIQPPSRPKVSPENAKFCTEMKKQKLRVGKDAYYAVIGGAGFSHSWEVLDRKVQLSIFQTLKAIPDGGMA